jgi:autotransporter-associated beta strand protein
MQLTNYPNLIIGRPLLRSALFALLTCSAVAAPGDVLYQAEFNTPGDLEGWGDGSNTYKEFDFDGATFTGEETTASGALRASVQGNDPKSIINGLTIDGSLAGRMEVRYRVASGPGTWEASLSETDIAVVRGVNIGSTTPFPNGADGWHLAVWDLDIGTFNYLNIGNLRFDLFQPNEGQQFEIDYVRVIESGNPPPLLEIDPAGALSGFTLIEEWDTEAELDLLVTNNIADMSTTGGVLRGTAANGDPQVQNPAGLNISVGPTELLVIEVGVLSSSPTTVSNLFYGDTAGSIATPGRRLDFAALASPAADTPHLLRATFDGDITGALNAFRYDPANLSAGAPIAVDFIRIYKLENPAPVIEKDPGALPAGYSLVQQWDTDLELAELETRNMKDVSIAGGLLTGAGLTGDSQILNPSTFAAIPVAANTGMIIEVGFIQSSPATDVVLFYDDGAGGFATPGHALTGTAFAADDNLHVMRVTFDNDIETSLDAFRVDPTSLVDGPIQLDYIRIYSNDSSASAIYWDTDLATALDQGGTGPWDTVTANFNDGNGNSVWPTTLTGREIAGFRGTPGTVSIDSAGITASSLAFEVDGYNLDGGSLTLVGILPTASVDTGTATIAADIFAYTRPVKKSGAGTLVIEGQSTFQTVLAEGGNLTVAPSGSIRTLGDEVVISGFLTFAVRLTADATLDVDGTIVATSGAFGGFSGSDYTINVNTGADVSTGDGVVGWNSTATLNLNGGATNFAGFLRHEDGGSGFINVLGGTHSVDGLLGSRNNNDGSDNVITISGGQITAGADTENDVGVGILVGDRVAFSNPGSNSLTVNLDGGILETNRIYVGRSDITEGTLGGGETTLNLNLNGGTLRALAGSPSTALVDGDLGAGSAFGINSLNVIVLAGGAIIDTNGEDKSIDLPLQAGAVSGGGLTKLGAGVLTLQGANTYTGDTLIADGMLQTSLNDLVSSKSVSKFNSPKSANCPPALKLEESALGHS